MLDEREVPIGRDRLPPYSQRDFSCRRAIRFRVEWKTTRNTVFICLGKKKTRPAPSTALSVRSASWTMAAALTKEMEND